MAQGVSASQSPPYLEALPNHGTTWASQSSRAAIMNGSANISASPSNPEIEQVDDRVNTNPTLKTPLQDDPWWRKTVLTFGL